MTDLPLSVRYNLGRLGSTGDSVHIQADEAQCAAIAQWCGALSVERFGADVDIRKLSPTRFQLDYRLTAEVTQACVVSLEKVPGRLERSFTRELHFAGPARHAPAESEVRVDPGEDDVPEEIDNLHYDLARPLLEEYSLALEPYPRAPGVAFCAQEAPESKPESPFAVLKGLK